MTPEQIKAWAAVGESETMEFKKSTAEKDRACRTLCAFANGRGGRLLFGVTPSGNPVGQSVSDRTLEDLAQEFQAFEPPLFPTVERVAIGAGREVLAVSVARAARVPVAFRGVAYERVLNTTRTMPRETYQRLLLEEMHATERWENQAAEGWDVSRLDAREMVLTLEESIRRGRMEDPGTREPMEILRGLGLLVHGDRLSRAAVVLFCKDEEPQPDFPQLLLKVARFKGVNRDEFLDNRQFYGNAFTLMRRAERFLIDSLPVAGRVVPGRLAREDTRRTNRRRPRRPCWNRRRCCRRNGRWRKGLFGARPDVPTVRVTRYPANLLCKRRLSRAMLTFGAGYLGMRSLGNSHRVNNTLTNRGTNSRTSSTQCHYFVNVSGGRCTEITANLLIYEIYESHYFRSPSTGSAQLQGGGRSLPLAYTGREEPGTRICTTETQRHRGKNQELHRNRRHPLGERLRTGNLLLPCVSPGLCGEELG